MSKVTSALCAALIAMPLVMIGNEASAQGAQDGGPQASPPPATGGGGGGGFGGGGFRGLVDEGVNFFWREGSQRKCEDGRQKFRDVAQGEEWRHEYDLRSNATAFANVRTRAH